MNNSLERQIRRTRKLARRNATLDRLASKAGSRLWQFQLARRSRDASDWFAPGDVIMINPQNVDRFLWRLDLLDELGATQRDLIGQATAGDWDKSHPLSELGIFDALRQRFVEQRDWSSIAFFDQMRASVLAGEPRFKYRTEDDFERQFERIDQLWENLQREGYRSQAELGTDRPWDEVVIAFDRFGRTVFVDGRHRLALAKIMGLTSIPAFVALRHEKWVQQGREFIKHIEEHSGVSYQPVPHPDFARFPSKKGHERFAMIRAALPVDSGRLLDVGSNKGYMCHRFEDAGFDCVAAERSERELFFLRMFHRAGERRFEIVSGDVLTKRFESPFDVVLALNIFHHFLKDESGVDALRQFLDRLDTQFMVFEPHLADDPQMRNAHLNLGPQEFLEFVKTSAALPNSTWLGDAEDGRPVYLLSKEVLPDPRAAVG